MAHAHDVVNPATLLVLSDLTQHSAAPDPEQRITNSRYCRPLASPASLLSLIICIFFFSSHSPFPLRIWCIAAAGGALRRSSKEFEGVRRSSEEYKGIWILLSVTLFSIRE